LPAPTTAVGEAIFVRMACHVVGSPLIGIVTLGRATGVRLDEFQENAVKDGIFLVNDLGKYFNLII